MGARAAFLPLTLRLARTKAKVVKKDGDKFMVFTNKKGKTFANCFYLILLINGQNRECSLRFFYISIPKVQNLCQNISISRDKAKLKWGWWRVGE